MNSKDDRKTGGAPKQEQGSAQSGGNPSGAGKRHSGSPGGQQSEAGIGTSQGQDREKRSDSRSRSSPERPSAGTPDIERGDNSPGNGGSQDSLVNDSTGAFKERP
jgi:hypothetical protein